MPRPRGPPGPSTQEREAAGNAWPTINVAGGKRAKLRFPLPKWKRPDLLSPLGHELPDLGRRGPGQDPAPVAVVHALHRRHRVRGGLGGRGAAGRGALRAPQDGAAARERPGQPPPRGPKRSLSFSTLSTPFVTRLPLGGVSSAAVSGCYGVSVCALQTRHSLPSIVTFISGFSLNSYFIY